MQNTWTGQNVDLTKLAEHISDVFKANDFEFARVETEIGYEITADDSSKYKIKGCLKANITGKPDNFAVSLKLCAEERRLTFPVILTTMFGGGYFLLKDLKSDEAWIKFEKIFWQNVNRIVAELQNSGGSRQQTSTLQETQQS